MFNLSDINTLKQNLKKLGLFAKKEFGQNFLINNQVLEEICNAAKIQKDETILEIGPGPGGLTQKLLQKTNQVIAIEFDPEMIKLLQNNLGPQANLKIIHQNALEYIPTQPNYKIVANIPYHITSPLLRHYLLEVEHKPSLVILMIQDEVAQKITDHKNQSVLSLQVKVFGEPKYLFKVPKNDFYPAPKIDSAVISIQAFPKPLVSPEMLNQFFKTIKIGFSQKRKKLMNSFLSTNRFAKQKLEEIFAKSGIDPDRRPQTLSIEEWKQLSQNLNS